MLLINKTKKIIVLAIGVFITVNLQGCERDDICAASTTTTPRLIIEFYDVTSTEDLKSVPRLTAYGEDLVTDPNEETDTDLLLAFNENLNVLELPLIIENEDIEVTSRFILERDTNLRLDEDVTTDSNIDIIEVSYIPEFEYVSRACGYKSIFTNLTVNVDSNDLDPWISNIIVDVETIENENTVHVRILH